MFVLVKQIARSYESEKTLNSDLIRQKDVVAITFDHSNIDYNLLRDNATYVFDTRNVMHRKGLSAENCEVL